MLRQHNPRYAPFIPSPFVFPLPTPSRFLGFLLETWIRQKLQRDAVQGHQQLAYVFGFHHIATSSASEAQLQRAMDAFHRQATDCYHLHPVAFNCERLAAHIESSGAYPVPRYTSRAHQVEVLDALAADVAAHVLCVPLDEADAQTARDVQQLVARLCKLGAAPTALMVQAISAKRPLHLVAWLRRLREEQSAPPLAEEWATVTLPIRRELDSNINWLSSQGVFSILEKSITSTIQEAPLEKSHSFQIFEAPLSPIQRLLSLDNVLLVPDLLNDFNQING